ncbi:MAG TPA: hypothetical protein PKV43_13690, partial [Armatimonadota bacterium]|nr:hypothetical protein [Armatimonadota bacterium]
FAVTLLLTVAFIHQSWSTRFLRWQYSLEGDELQVYDLMKRGRACLHLKDISAIDDFNIVIKRGLSIRGHVLRTTQGVEIQLSDELTSWQEILSKYQECQNKRV